MRIHEDLQLHGCTSRGEQRDVIMASEVIRQARLQENVSLVWIIRQAYNGF